MFPLITLLGQEGGRHSRNRSSKAPIMDRQARPSLREKKAASRALFDLYPGALDHLGPLGNLGFHEWLDIHQRHG